MGNYVKAIVNCLSKSYQYLEPTLWKPTVFSPSPYQEHTDFLSKKKAEKKFEEEDSGY